MPGGVEPKGILHNGILSKGSLRRRRVGPALAAGLLLTGLLLATTASTTSTEASADTSVLNPVQDAYTRSDTPDGNFGTGQTLHIDGSPVSVAYLKFDVAGLTGAPSKATLKIFVTVSSTTSINASPVPDTTWTETGLTWNNRPAPGSPSIPSPTPITANTFLSYDVTSLVHGNGLVSFAIDTASATSKDIPSRENTTAANRPQLIVESATTTTPPPTTTTTPPTTTPPTTQPSTTQPTTTTTTPSGDPVIAVAGDVACGTTEANYNGGLGTADACHMLQTSDLILAMAPQQTWALGDLQYNSGAPADFAVSYQNSWGRFKPITRPAVGNHEYGTSGAGGYFGYFGDSATPQQPGCVKSCNGYYSFDIGSWHVAVINSECSRLNGGTGCAVGSPQHQWLDADLAAHTTGCTAVLSHRPRWASNSFASADIQPLVDVMGARGVDLFLAGHAHSYERFAPQDAAGQADPNGITEIAVGTGGRDSQGFGTVVPNSVIHKNKIFGVMRLTLHPKGWDTTFVPDPATPFADSSSGACH